MLCVTHCCLHCPAELKDKWTLALPPIRWVPHWHDSPHLVPVVTGDRREDVQKARETGTWKWVAWSDLLNVDALRKYISVTTYDDFLAENGPELSTAVHMRMCVRTFGAFSSEEVSSMRFQTHPSMHRHEYTGRVRAFCAFQTSSVFRGARYHQ